MHGYMLFLLNSEKFSYMKRTNCSIVLLEIIHDSLSQSSCNVTLFHLIVNDYQCSLTVKQDAMLICSNCQAVRLLGPPASFDASKLKVVFLGEGMNDYSRILPRTYILSHCDFTANLTLTISNVINLEQVCIRTIQ